MRKMKKSSVNLIFILCNLLPIFGYSQIAKPIKDIKIGNQLWMVENLNVDKFRNGDPIPEAKSDEEWKKASEEEKPAWCYNNDDLANGKKYGKLYNYFAVKDSRGIAPKGWKVASDADWLSLINFLGGDAVAGKKLKFNNFWSDINGKSGNGNNESGFAAMPGGGRMFNGTFFSGGLDCFWWNSSELSHGLNNNSESVNEGFNNDPSAGYSVRCIRE
jgi:uncharacterized protein (TIGR02145 family)